MTRVMAVRIVWIFLGLFITLATVFIALQFRAPERGTSEERLVIPLGTDGGEAVSLLEEEGFIRNALALHVALFMKGADAGDAEPGGYVLSRSMSVFEVAETLSHEPRMVWVVIPPGLRKEEIAERLSESLGWDEAKENEWVEECTERETNYREGVYFPDTYLIEREAAPCEMAERMRVRFEEVFEPYAKEALSQNIRWPTLLKVASLVQREAAGKSDMPLVAGILWNRLLSDMRLEIDATLQYARGDTGSGYWAPISVAEKQIDSPFNTYRNSGLPPTPIANPGRDAIEAVLYPTETECVFYLHDNSGGIHCAVSLEEHEQNIDRYLR